jgi:hypothetical protein
MVSVLPDPAPATTNAGSVGAAITAACSGVGTGNPSALATSTGESTARADVIGIAAP